MGLPLMSASGIKSFLRFFQLQAALGPDVFSGVSILLLLPTAQLDSFLMSQQFLHSCIPKEQENGIFVHTVKSILLLRETGSNPLCL